MPIYFEFSSFFYIAFLSLKDFCYYYRHSILLSAVNSTSLVCVKHKEELLDMIQAHSEYERDNTIDITYNWVAIEQEVLRRYIGNKPRIAFTRDQLPYYVYQEDFNLHNQMQAIKDSQVTQ